MRYHTNKPATYGVIAGEPYSCDHPVYSRCTLFRDGLKGMAVIQQYYNSLTKHTWWDEVEPWLTGVLYSNPGFKKFLGEKSGESVFGLYPTVTVRQLMWALKIKPLPKQRWETVFDRKDI